MRVCYILIAVALVIHNTSQQESSRNAEHDGEPDSDTEGELDIPNVDTRDTGKNDGEPDYDATDDTKSRVSDERGILSRNPPES